MDRMLGQDRAVDLLQRALASGRMHHAWIFSGPQGVGKHTAAIELARILLDPDASPDLAGRIAADPAGRVSNLIDGGSHPDLHIINRELALYSDNPLLRSRKLRNIAVDVLREHIIGGKTGDDRIHEGAAYRTAAMGHGKVFIIDEAERMDATAQNAILKTLEEPPPRTYIILVTSSPERLLPTILSRCQHVRFGPLGEQAMKQWLDRAALDIDAEHRRWLQRFADGSPGQVLRAIEYDFFTWARTLAPLLGELAQGRYPAEMGQTLAALVDGFATTWVKQHQNASKELANRDGAAAVFQILASEARRRLAEAAETSDGDLARQWTRIIDLIHEAESQLDANVNQKMVFENLVAQWRCEVTHAVV